jgi:hypothetical protein
MMNSVQEETEALQNVPGCYPGCEGGSWIDRWLLLTFLKRIGSPLQFSLLLTKWWRECRPGRGKNKRRQLYKFSAWEPHVPEYFSSIPVRGRHEIPGLFLFAFTSSYDIFLYKWFPKTIVLSPHDMILWALYQVYEENKTSHAAWSSHYLILFDLLIFLCQIFFFLETFVNFSISMRETLL